jgi:hypothetical protein
MHPGQCSRCPMLVLFILVSFINVEPQQSRLRCRSLRLRVRSNPNAQNAEIRVDRFPRWAPYKSVSADPVMRYSRNS